jgi:pyridoxal phosphate enzyme (YggS family)
MKLIDVLHEIEKAGKLSKFAQNVVLVAVSKTKPAHDIMELYNQGQRVFGENYVDELVEKAQELPKDIRWHFIGHLQSNKIKELLSVDNLECIQTVDSANLCGKLNKRLQEKNKSLDIYTQVKISEEESKSGVEPGELPHLLDYIDSQCPQLTFKGLMTIGPIGDLSIFKNMQKIKEELESKGRFENIELSMGMSGDYKEAIIEGATIVRIGSALFGERIQKNKV